MKGLRTYLAGLLSAATGIGLLLVGHFHPPAPMDPLLCQVLIFVGFAAMGVRGLLGAKTGR